MRAIKTRIGSLEAAGHAASNGALILSWGGEDEQGKPVSELISVVGYGWGASRSESETEEEFRHRAEQEAAKNGHPNLWARPTRQVTIGGEQ
jgi:hypothetical protein